MSNKLPNKPDPKNNDDLIEKYIFNKLKNVNFAIKISLELYAGTTSILRNFFFDADKSHRKIRKEYDDIHKYIDKRMKKRKAKIIPQYNKTSDQRDL